MCEIIEDELEFVTNELCAIPRRCVVVEISSDPNMDILVIDFCLAFSKKWRAIIIYHAAKGFNGWIFGLGSKMEHNYYEVLWRNKMICFMDKLNNSFSLYE